MAHRGRKSADTALQEALLCGATAEQAAQAADVGLRTVYRRLADGAFQAQLQTLRDDMVRRQADTLTAAGQGAIKALLNLLQPSVPPAVQLGAIRTILEMALKFRAVAGWETRLTALEQQLRREDPGVGPGPPPATHPPQPPAGAASPEGLAGGEVPAQEEPAP
jgi:hypothetical protein